MTWRNVDTAMWTNDDWFLGLEPDAKLVFIYLFTNPDTNITGLYKLPSLRLVSFQIGVSPARLDDILAEFSRDGKVYYADGWVFVVNMQKRQISQVSRQLAAHIRKHLDTVPDNAMRQMYLSRYRYPDDTLSIAYPYPISRLLVGYVCPTTKQKQETDTETDTDTTIEDDAQVFAETPPPSDTVQARYAYMMERVGMTNNYNATAAKFRAWFESVAMGRNRPDFDRAVDAMREDYIGDKMAGMSVWQRTEHYLKNGVASSDGALFEVYS